MPFSSPAAESDTPPPESAERALLEELIGELRPGFPVVLAGETGCGRTVLCLELAWRFCARGDGVVLLTAEPPRLLLDQARSLALELEPALRAERLILLEMDAQIAQVVRSHGGQALAEALSTEARADTSLLLVDPLTAVIPELLDESEARGLVRALFHAAGGAGQSAVFTAEKEILAEMPHLERLLQEACGAFVDVGRTSPERHVLEVRKCRAGGFERGPVQFRVEARGLVRQEPGPDCERNRARDQMEQTALPAATARHKILVVDSDVDARGRFAGWLGERYEVREAPDGFAAVSCILSWSPDLVTLDVDLPRASGWEVLRALRDAGATIPALVVAERILRSADRVRALVLGASDLLRKPVFRFELLHKVDALLRKSGVPQPVLHAEDLEAMLGGERVRLRDESAFRGRLERAWRVGEEYGLHSTLLALGAPSADVMDRLVGAAERTLRAEDAVLAIGKTRALVLLVATPPETVGPVLLRFAELMRREGESSRGLVFCAAPALPPAEGAGWRGLFAQLRPFPLSAPVRRRR